MLCSTSVLTGDSKNIDDDGQNSCTDKFKRPYQQYSTSVYTSDACDQNINTSDYSKYTIPFMVSNLFTVLTRKTKPNLRMIIPSETQLWGLLHI